MRAIEIVLIGATVTALGCAQPRESALPAGEYPRSSVRLLQGRREMPVPTEGALADALPPSIRLDNANHFAVDSGEATMTGTYFVERDSIFFVQHVRGHQRVVFAGRASGDRIDVHLLPALGDESIPAGMDVELSFVRNKAGGRKGRFPH